MEAELENYQNDKKTPFFQNLLIHLVQYKCDAIKLCGIRLSKKEW